MFSLRLLKDDLASARAELGKVALHPASSAICSEGAMPRLGFSDLNEDEALAIGLFRDWSANFNRRSDFEKQAREVLERDPISRVISHLFTIFQEIASRELATSGAGDVLSPCEVEVLDLLSTSLSSIWRGEHGPQDPDGTGGFRRTQDMLRSGRDDLVLAINCAGHRVIGVL